MNYRIVFYILGKVIIFLGLFLLLPFAVALIYQEKSGIYFLITAIISLVVGLLLSYKKPKDKRFYAREGFVVVALSWIVMSIIGACPFFFSGEIPSMVDAVFLIITQPEPPRCLLLLPLSRFAPPPPPVPAVPKVVHKFSKTVIPDI